MAEQILLTKVLKYGTNGKMPLKPLKLCIVAHINFQKSVRTPSELRYIYQEFSRLGKLIYWTDYWSKAGFSHHSSRSMAVFQVNDQQKLTLVKSLESIVAVPLIIDFKRLKDGVVQDIKPMFKQSKNVEISHATYDDPFFRANGDSEGVRISSQHSIPMIVKTQNLIDSE